MSELEQGNNIDQDQWAEMIRQLQALAEKSKEPLWKQLATGKSGEPVGAVERATNLANSGRDYSKPYDSGPRTWSGWRVENPTSSQKGMENSANAQEMARQKVPSLLNIIRSNSNIASLQIPPLKNALTTLGTEKVQIDGQMAKNLKITIDGLHPNLPNQSVSISAMELNKKLS